MSVFSKRSHEGYLIIDHSASPGMPDKAMPAGMTGQGIAEMPTYTCNHCQAVVIMNPDRTRERSWCRHCDHYICDACGGILKATGVCKTFEQIIEEAQEAALKK